MSRTTVLVPELFAAPPPPLSSPRSRAVDTAADAASAVMVTVAGELDVARVAHLDCELRRAEAHAELVLVDLRALQFIDSSGARLLVAAHRRIRGAGGRMLVVRGPAEIDWFFALIGVDRELELVDWPPLGRSAPFDEAIA
jgi:anti-sigma B factor antagonist